MDGGEEFSERDLGHLEESVWDLKVVGFVVVQVEHAEELRVSAHAQLLVAGHPLSERLASELLHLDVEELAEITEPLDELGGDAAIELYVWEEDLQGVGAGVARVEEH